MSELAPVLQTREALIADAICIGTEMLDIDPRTAKIGDSRMVEDPTNAYRHTWLPEGDFMHLWGPKPGDEATLPIRLVANPGWGRDNEGSRRYSFWADGSVGRLYHSAWHEGGVRETLIPVDDAELADFVREMSDTRDVLKLRLGISD